MLDFTGQEITRGSVERSEADKALVRADRAAYVDRHRDRVNAQQSASYYKNRDAKLKQAKDRYHADPAVRERISMWQRNNRDKVRIYAMLKNAKDRAAQFGLPYDLELQDIVIPETCPVLGIILSFGKGEAHDGSPSIDRLIPQLGYVKTNVAVISRRANTIKSFGTAEEHKRIVEWINGKG